MVGGGADGGYGGPIILVGLNTGCERGVALHFARGRLCSRRSELRLLKSDLRRFVTRPEEDGRKERRDIEVAIGIQYYPF